MNNQEINKLWEAIADFEAHELKNDSKDPLLAKARQDARMQAYIELSDKLMDIRDSK
jgi:hypothetical protein